jgi:hypothetical protein
MRRMSGEAPPIVCMFTTIQTRIISIRTVYGDSGANASTGHYGQSLSKELDKGTPAQIWAVVSTPFSTCRYEGVGLTGRRDHRYHYQLYRLRLVDDDTDLIITSQNP